MPKFVGPTVRIKYGHPNDLWFAGVTRGKTVVKVGGTWRTVVSPSEDFLATCSVVLRGGYEHQIDQALADELTANGYGEYVSED